MKAVPSLSIVMEWENAKHSDFMRGQQVLILLAEQLRKLSNDAPTESELILVYDEGEWNTKELIACLADPIASFPAPVRMAPCSGLDYYEQKNFGAQQAKHEAILFVDCDVVPCSGWLKNLLDCYVDEHADVVCGETHVEKRSIYEKAFAAFWFFPLASEVQQRSNATRFFANNVLFRAEVFKGTPFPNFPLVRGQCGLLAEKLLKDRRSIYLEPRAKVIHPPPNGFVHFVKRALCAGQDNVVLHADSGQWRSIRRFLGQINYAAKRIISHRQEVELGLFGVMNAICIAIAYITLEFIGEIISLINPEFIRKNLRI